MKQRQQLEPPARGGAAHVGSLEPESETRRAPPDTPDRTRAAEPRRSGRERRRGDFPPSGSGSMKHEDDAALISASHSFPSGGPNGSVLRLQADTVWGSKCCVHEEKRGGASAHTQSGV
ncbi:hypothetical protein EYF80_046656 [Liparis tanakae]|uniref:Uncharacterized protein n=1 Tax=Liparis tanakae TaxID=230148 RepID=A0A4Z2FRY5_9TELE|nr:hypothetical protein EYF80_046656 [Liparis tanakae]